MAPTTAPARYGELRFKQETVAGEAIADSPNYWITSPKKLRVFDVDPAIPRAVEQDMALQTDLFADPPNFVLVKQPRISGKSYLSGLAQTAASGVAVTSDDLGLFLKAALGGESLGTTRVVGGGNTGTGTDAAPVLVDSSTGLTPGGGVIVTVNGVPEARRIRTIPDATHFTTDVAFSAAPAAATLVKAAATYYLDESALSDLNSADHLTFAALFRGYHSEDQWEHRGCHPEVELMDVGDPTKAPKFSWILHALDALYATGGVAVGTIPSEAKPAALKNSGLYLSESTALTKYHTRSADIKLGLKKDAIPSPGGLEGIVGHIFPGGGRTTLEFETFFDSEWDARFAAQTVMVGGYQLGSGLLVSFGRLTLDEAPTRAGQGATYAKVKMHADSGAVTTNELTRSRVSIHRFAA